MGSKDPWWRHPPEDHAEGCPGSWMRSMFAVSFSKYYRHRADGGVRVSNLALDDCDDWLVRDAVMYFEREEERRIAHHEKIRFDAIEAKRKAAKQKGPR